MEQVMQLAEFLVLSFSASTAGAICGIGGGIIMKPVLDAAGILPVSSISFLSGCTVLSMAMITVCKKVKQGSKVIDTRRTTPLAIGAALGGVLGKKLFQYAYVVCPDENRVGAIQAGVLIIVTLVTLLYTLKMDKVKTCQIRNIGVCCLAGLFLGILSSFLGIGGGPINLVILSFFFSMDTKTSAANSIYVIVFSQLASLIETFIRGSVPEFSVAILLVMIAGGVAGGCIGGRIDERISAKHVQKLFVGLMIVIIGINMYNINKFLR